MLLRATITTDARSFRTPAWLSTLAIIVVGMIIANSYHCAGRARVGAAIDVADLADLAGALAATDQDTPML